ncbi:MAG: hypothetical protein KBS59_06785, partial [Clostridiales bacterium]|nr:hypothetical protein [Clostridiales bacterium]
GLYCNMSGFVGMDYSGKTYGLCTCDACRKAYLTATGLDVPTVFDPRKPEVMKYIGFQSGMGRKLREKMNAVLKAISPEIAVDKIDYFRTESHTDIGDPVWIYSASSNSRLASGPARNHVSDNASADFIGFRYRESAVSPGVLELRQWQNLANSGNVSAFFLGRMDNHPDRAYYEGTKRVFDFHRSHEEELRGLKSEANVLLVWKNQAGRSDPEAYGWVRALTESHIPFDETRSAGLFPEMLENKKLVILADAKDLGQSQAEMIDAFCESGGFVIASGDSGVRGRADSLRCLGIKQITEKSKNLMSSVFSVEKEDADTFVRSAVSPRIVPGTEIVNAEYEETATGYLTLLYEPPYGPPEVCYAKEWRAQSGVTVNSFGRGKGVYIPWNTGSFYHAEGYTNTLNFMRDVLFGIYGLSDIAPSLHPSVELVRAGKDGKHSLALINASGYFGNSFFDPIPMTKIEIAVSGAKNIKCLNGGTVTAADDKIILDKLDRFEMIIWED